MFQGTKLNPILYTKDGCDQCWNCQKNGACLPVKHGDGKYYIHPQCNGFDIMKAEVPCSMKIVESNGD